MDCELHSPWLLINILLFAGGLWILIRGSGVFVKASSDIARRFRVSELVIGLTLVSIGTSLPEMASSLYASFRDQPEFIFGNVVGSCTTNIALILGAGALLCGRLRFSGSLLSRDMVFMLFVFLTASLLIAVTRVSGGGGAEVPGISRPGGLFMMVLAAWYIRRLIRGSSAGGGEPGPEGNAAKNCGESATPPQFRPQPPAWRCCGSAALGLIMVVAGSKLLVDNVVWGAEALGVSTMIISVTVVAFGTSVPELAVTLTGALKHHHDLAVGNIVGSCTFNILMIFGCCALVRPLALAGMDCVVNLALMIGSGALLFVCMAVGKCLNRAHGALLLLFYAVFLAYNCRMLW